MAFNFDHTSNGDIGLNGAHVAFTGDFIFPLPMQSRDYHILMTDNAGFGLDALADINQELTNKVNISDLGSAAYLNADDVDLPLLVFNGTAMGVLSDSVIPASILNTQHSVDFTGGLKFLNATKGDIATVVSDSKTYILTGNSKVNDWVALEVEDPLVCGLCLWNSINSNFETYTGDIAVQLMSLYANVCRDPNDFPDCHAITDDVEYVVNWLYSNKAIPSDIENLISLADIQCGVETCSLTDVTTIDTCIGVGATCYLTSDYLSSCLSNYVTSTSLDSNLCDNYVRFSQAGLQSYLSGKAGHCIYSFIEDGGTLVKVNNDGKLDSCLFGSIAYNTHYAVTSEADLASLNAQAGDIAIGAVGQNGKTWILDNSGNWQVVVAASGGLYFLNGQSPDGYGCLSLDTEDFLLNSNVDSTTTSTKITEVSNYIACVTSTEQYQSESAFSSCLSSNFITVSDFSNCLILKSDNGHSHLICEITDLETCLNSYPPSPFVTGSCNSASTDPSISMGGIMNVVFGQGGSDAGYDYAVIHAAGSGDAQTIEFKRKNCSSNYVGDIVFGQDGLDLVSADVVAFDSLGNNVSYRVEGLFSTSAGATSAIGETAVTTFAENVGGCSSNAILVPTSNCVQICVDSSHGTFDYALANVSLVHVH